MPETTTVLPDGFGALLPWVADWAVATRAERYAVRLSKPIEQLEDFYDAVAPLAEPAMQYLDPITRPTAVCDPTRSPSYV